MLLNFFFFNVHYVKIIPAKKTGHQQMSAGKLPEK